MAYAAFDSHPGISSSFQSSISLFDIPSARQTTLTPGRDPAWQPVAAPFP